MPTLIEKPTRIEAAGHPPKLIDEYVGRLNTGDGRLSVAHMRGPAGWTEPGQRPEFDEFTMVLAGAVRVEHEGGELEAKAGQAVLARAGEWVRVQHPRRGGIHRRMLAGIFTGHGASRYGAVTTFYLFTLYAAGKIPYGWLVTPFLVEPTNTGGDARIITLTTPVWPAGNTPA